MDKHSTAPYHMSWDFDITCDMEVMYVGYSDA